MQWSLFVLILMGQCSFFTCHLYDYHFIQEKRSWDDAQSYCTEKYTDLATVSNMRDVERLTNPPQTGAWIGLRSINEADIKEWHWSLPGEKYNPTECEPEWGPHEPNNGGNHPKNCVKIKLSQKWHNVHCSHRLNFICYNETGPQKYFLIVHPKYWLQAQSHCRKHHTDLVSGLTEIRSEEFKSITKEFNHDHLWIGLFRDTWSWSDGKNFSFRHWDPVLFKDEALKTCAMTTENGKWNSDKCTVKKPFYCYDDKVILINESKTWDEALDYCRANHSDLVSITDSHQQRWVEKRAKMADTEFVWLGMRYTCTLDLWFWVSDRLVCYHNWAQQEKTEGCDRATAMETDGKWYKKADNEKFNFICVK